MTSHRIGVSVLIGAMALAGAAMTAHAQFPTETLTLEIVWENAPTFGVPAKGAIYATVTPDLGTTVKWDSSPDPKYQNGTLMAFASCILDLKNQQNGTTGTLTWSVPTEFNLANKQGTPDGSGGLTFINAGQFGPPGNANPVVTPKVKLLDLSWSTTDFTFFREVSYATVGKSANVYLDVGVASWVGEKAVIVNDSGGFLVVPAPSTALLAMMGLGLASRRRRRG